MGLEIKNDNPVRIVVNRPLLDHQESAGNKSGEHADDSAVGQLAT